MLNVLENKQVSGVIMVFIIFLPFVKKERNITTSREKRSIFKPINVHIDKNVSVCISCVRETV